MPFQIIRNDITKISADAIVNTANPDPIYGGGTDAAIYKAAGAQKLLEERKKIGSLKPGEAAVTPAFDLNAKFIIHTVGPIWQGGGQGEFDQLASCYRKSLLIARQLNCNSIAFPLISTGVYGFPKDKALEIALKEISDFQQYSEMDITLVVFDRKAFSLSSGLVADIEQYIDENYVKAQSAEEYYGGSPASEERRHSRRRFSDIIARRSGREDNRRREQSSQPAQGSLPPHSFSSAQGSPPVQSSRPQMQEPCLMDSSAPYETDEKAEEAMGASPDYFLQADEAMSGGRPKRSLEDVMSQTSESFQECLLRLIDEHGFTDTEVYKRANIDRKLFSKIRCNADYMPGRKTIISLAIALKPNMDEMTDLLRKAGIALSPRSKFDLIIRYCVENQIYDPMQINALLFDYTEKQEQLGAS